MSSRQFVLPIVLTLLAAVMVVGIGFAEVLPIEMFDGGGGEGSVDVAATAPEVSAEVAAEVEAGVEVADHADRLDVTATAATEDDRVVLAAEDQEEIGKTEEGNLLAVLSIEASGEVSGEAGTEASDDRAREPDTAADSGTPDRATANENIE